MKALFTELQWLPTVPKDFGSRLKSLQASLSPIGQMFNLLLCADWI
jgi:hypothetical protein